jgi:hypothetical protein
VLPRFARERVPAIACQSYHLTSSIRRALRCTSGSLSLEGNTRRAIDFHEGDRIDEKALKALVHARRGTEHILSRPAARDESIEDSQGFEAEWGEPRRYGPPT